LISEEGIKQYVLQAYSFLESLVSAVDSRFDEEMTRGVYEMFCDIVGIYLNSVQDTLRYS